MYIILNVSVIYKGGVLMNWFNNKKTKESIRFHPGVYKFQIPYLLHDLIANENNEMKVSSCEVEMHVGREDDLKQGTIATIIMTSTTEPMTNIIEYIATSIYHTMFRDIFYTYLMEKNLLIDRIRWVEKYDSSVVSFSSNSRCDDVTFQWDEKQQSYYNPSWYQPEEDAWYRK